MRCTETVTDGEIILELCKIHEADPVKRYVPARVYKIYRAEDHALAGGLSLRLGHNENTYFGGNIGYEIYEPYRGRHYAAKACRLAFDIARREGMEYLIITCDPANTASRRTCEYAGAVLEQIVEIPPHIEMYQTGRRQSCQYILRL
jgi:predicted acetyltransferase